MQMIDNHSATPEQWECFAQKKRNAYHKKEYFDTELIAKARIVVTGDVDPYGEVPLDDGGFSTVALTCSQMCYHLLISPHCTAEVSIRLFDSRSAFLAGEEHDRD